MVPAYLREQMRPDEIRHAAHYTALSPKRLATVCIRWLAQGSHASRIVCLTLCYFVNKVAGDGGE
jgi:hypothetical protein